jgi:hypothetical protein
MADSDTVPIRHVRGEWQRAFAMPLSYSVSEDGTKAIGTRAFLLLKAASESYFEDSARVVGIRSRCMP